MSKELQERLTAAAQELEIVLAEMLKEIEK